MVDEDEVAFNRAQRRATDELGALADALRRHGNNASQRLQEEGIVVEVVFRGRSTTVPALAAALTVEVEDRERLLSEREREILENHLVNEVASSLQELISAAEAQVLVMNSELADRPTSTGMRLRLLWQTAPDGPQGLAAARDRLLRRHADAWSPDERAAVGSFLQAQIQAVRARDTGGTWLEHLTDALDYRAWHRFTIQRYQAGQWRSATGPASGGERVLAASVPLFAAASSHYASAGNPHAPRLVMLDEAFAGVDDDSRAKCLGLLTAFDLDVVMTSEREWGCYPEVPGLAIAQLSRVDGVAAVLVTHWEWDGATRVSVDRPRAAPRAYVQTAATGAASRAGEPVGLPDDERLTRLLGDPELAWLMDRVRRRLELGLQLDTTVTLAGASVAQRQAVHRLLGRAPRHGLTLSVSLPALDALIRRSGACDGGLAAASSLLSGPLVTRADAERAVAGAWDRAFETLERTVGTSPHPELSSWLSDVRASGRVKRLEPDPSRPGSCWIGWRAWLTRSPSTASLSEPLRREQRAARTPSTTASRSPR